MFLQIFSMSQPKLAMPSWSKCPSHWHWALNIPVNPPHLREAPNSRSNLAASRDRTCWYRSFSKSWQGIRTYQNNPSFHIEIAGIDGIAGCSSHNYGIRGFEPYPSKWKPQRHADLWVGRPKLPVSIGFRFVLWDSIGGRTSHPPVLHGASTSCLSHPQCLDQPVQGVSMASAMTVVTTHPKEIMINGSEPW